MITGLVSAVVPVFCRAAMLREAVKSVLEQTYQPVEVIIVDDGSTDDTAEAIAKLKAAHQPNIRSVHQENSGPGAARNLGLQLARGEFIQYLDSDDLLEPRKFELQVQALRLNPHAGVAYGTTHRVQLETGDSRLWARTAESIAQIFPDFLLSRGWDTNSPLWRRSVCDEIGPWLELRNNEDWEHDLRAGILGVRPVHVDAHVATVRDHGKSRASGMNSGYTANILADLVQSHAAIWLLMRQHKLCDWSYLQEFSRKLFWLARMCGSRGMQAEAHSALTMANEMVSTHQRPYGMRLFGIAVRLLGWERAVRWSESVRAMLNPGAGRLHD
ncbi:MAG: glycosyltransferase family 2 protein [Pseudomarimonas sp.]